MKKYVALLLALCLALSLVACGGSDSSAPASTGSASSTAMFPAAMPPARRRPVGPTLQPTPMSI